MTSRYAPRFGGLVPLALAALLGLAVAPTEVPAQTDQICTASVLNPAPPPRSRI